MLHADVKITKFGNFFKHLHVLTVKGYLSLYTAPF